jgi:hypothetical protein
VYFEEKKKAFGEFFCLRRKIFAEGSRAQPACRQAGRGKPSIFRFRTSGMHPRQCCGRECHTSGQRGDRPH